MTVHTEIVSHKKLHLFTIHAGPTSIETNALIHCGSDKTLLRKNVAKRLNVEGTLQHLALCQSQIILI